MYNELISPPEQFQYGIPYILAVFVRNSVQRIYSFNQLVKKMWALQEWLSFGHGMKNLKVFVE